MNSRWLLIIAVQAACWTPLPAEPNTPSSRVPVIDVTDLYHPPQDPGDNLDLIAAYALPKVDLRAIVLDVTEEYRKPSGQVEGLPRDEKGPREPGFIPVQQLNESSPFRLIDNFLTTHRVNDAHWNPFVQIDVLRRALSRAA